MFDIYLKQLRKNWLIWSLVSFIIAAFSILMVIIWPSFIPYAEMINDMLELPLYQGMLGEGMPLNSLEGLLSMEMFIMSDIFFMGIILVFGIQCVTREVESGSLDFILAFPVPRWRFLLEKIAAFVTITFSYPVLTTVAAIVGVIITPDAEFQTNGMEAFFLALIARWILYLTLAFIVILISIIFMDSGKTLIFGGLFVGGSFLLDTLGGILATADPDMGRQIQQLSFHYYLDGPLIMKKILIVEEGFAGFPIIELIAILLIGIAAIIASLLLFNNPVSQKREFK